MMKKLLQLNPVLRTSTSTGRIMREIGEKAKADGWESYVAYSFGRDGDMESSSIPVPVGSRWSVLWHGIQTRLFDRHGLASDAAARELIRKIEEIRPDILHIHNIHGYFMNYKILFDYLSRSGIQVVWTVHDCWLYTGHCYYYSKAGCDRWKTGCGHCPQRRKFPASLFADRSARNFIDKRNAFCSMPKDRLTIVAVSEWIKGELAQSFLKDYPCRVIHNGIDTDVFAPQEGLPGVAVAADINASVDAGQDAAALDTARPSDSAAALRRKYGIGDRHVILGVASIWLEEKGIGDFIALARLLDDDEVIVLVGMSPEALAKTLKKYDAETLRDRIIPVRRTENVRQLAGLYGLADAFVNPTWQDNYPTVNVEAISCGTPVITYRTGGSIESVTPETGFVVGQGDVKGLKDAYKKVRMLGKQHFSGACRKYAIEHFRKEDRYEDYITLYKSLI